MKALLLLMLASTASDAYYTHRNLLAGHEFNPIVRPFVGSTHSQVLFFSANMGIAITASQLLSKHHHRRLGKAVLIEEIASHTDGAIYSATHQKTN